MFIRISFTYHHRYERAKFKKQIRDNWQPILNQLREQTPELKEPEIIFSSGRNIYIGTEKIAQKIRNKFFLQKDHACRYGSLLASNTKEIKTLNTSIKVKIVDSESKHPTMTNLVKTYETGDCHGKISRNIALQVGAIQKNAPFQFRGALNLAGNQSLIKGTFQINDHLTKTKGYDMILDRTSIKGYPKNTRGLEVTRINNTWHFKAKDNKTISKAINNTRGVDNQEELIEKITSIFQNYDVKFSSQEELSFSVKVPQTESDNFKNNLNKLEKVFGELGIDKHIPCGDYQVENPTLGTREQAKIQEYDMSWQVLIWFSEDAIKKDILPETQKEAERLREIQKDPRLLAQYVLDNYDRRKNLQNPEGDSEKEDLAMIKILREDVNHSMMLNHPKVTSYLQQQIQNRWKELAERGAKSLKAGLAQPFDCEPHTVIAPHLENGTKIFCGRYPVADKYNLCAYTVDNTQAPDHILRQKGCIFINPTEAMENHQCDFDGDYLFYGTKEEYPTIFQEIVVRPPKSENEGIVKLEKKPYPDDLFVTSVLTQDNSIGTIANLIGRVECVPKNLTDLPKRIQEKVNQAFTTAKQKLPQALQIEVDSPKAANRYTDAPELVKAVEFVQKNQECQNVPLFRYKNHENLYLTAPMPEGKAPIDLLAKEVNKHWEKATHQAISAEQFQSTPFPEIFQCDVEQDINKLVNEYTTKFQKNNQGLLQLAKDLLAEYSQKTQGIMNSNLREEEQKNSFKDLYNSLALTAYSNIESEENLDKLAKLVWLEETKEKESSSDNQHYKKCVEYNEKYEMGVHFYQIKEDPKRTDTLPPGSLDNTSIENSYILETPFEWSLTENNNQEKRFTAKTIANWLKKNNIEFQAFLDNNRPLVLFSFSQKAVEENDKKLHKVITKIADKYSPNSDSIDNNLLVNQKYKNTRKYITINKKKQELRITDNKKFSSFIKPDQYRKRALTINLFPENVAEWLKQASVSSKTVINIVGVKQPENYYHDTNLKDYLAQNQGEFSIQKSQGYRKGEPMVYLDNKPLGFLSSKSLPIPLGTKFTAKDIAEIGQGINLKVNEIQTSPISNLESYKKPKPPKLNCEKANYTQKRLEAKKNQQIIEAVVNYEEEANPVATQFRVAQKANSFDMEK